MQSNSPLLVPPAGWTADHSLLGKGTYEHCRTSFDWLRDAACFARRSWLQSAKSTVVSVEPRADTPRNPRAHYPPRARSMLRSAIAHVAPAWRLTAAPAA